MQNPKPVLSDPPSAHGHPPNIRFQVILNNCKDLVCIFDMEGRYVQVSESSRTILGYAPEELIGRNFTEFLAPDDLKRTEEARAEVLNGTNLSSFSNRYRKKDGTLVLIEWSATWDGEERLSVCIGREATEKKKMEHLQQDYERRLERSRQLNTDILERITDGFFSIDEQDTVTYCNRQAAVILKACHKAIIGKNIWACFPEAVDSTFYSEYHRSRREGVPVSFEAFYQPLNAWLETNIYPSAKGAAVFFRNITEKKKTEAELHRLSLIAEEIDTPIITTEADARINWVNKAFVKLYGFELEAVRGQKPSENLGGPDTCMETLGHVKECVRQGKEFACELVFYTRARQKLWLEVQGQPVRDEQGKVRMYFIIHTNVTERKKLQQQLQQQMSKRQKEIAYAEIKAQEKERSEIGKELHDNVNQMLTTVKLYNELCMVNTEMRDELLTKSVQYLNTCIQEIRSLSRALSAPTIGNISLKDSIRELALSIQATNKLSITYSAYGMEDRQFKKDVHIALFRIVQEHLTNVLKHANATLVELTLLATPATLTCMIQDNGVGFDLQQKAGGIGITNMISRAEVFNGTVHLKTAPGEGCILTVRFPLP